MAQLCASFYMQARPGSPDGSCGSTLVAGRAHAYLPRTSASGPSDVQRRQMASILFRGAVQCNMHLGPSPATTALVVRSQHSSPSWCLGWFQLKPPLVATSGVLPPARMSLAGKVVSTACDPCSLLAWFILHRRPYASASCSMITRCHILGIPVCGRLACHGYVS